MSMMDLYQDVSRREEVEHWIAENGFDVSDVEQWSISHEIFSRISGYQNYPIKLDLLKDWIDGKHSLADVFGWAFHTTQSDAVKLAQGLITSYRVTAEAHGGAIDLIGIDPYGTLHVAFTGNCGGCNALEDESFANFRRDALEGRTENGEHKFDGIEGVLDVVNDGVVLEKEQQKDFSNGQAAGGSLAPELQRPFKRIAEN